MGMKTPHVWVFVFLFFVFPLFFVFSLVLTTTTTPLPPPTFSHLFTNKNVCKKQRKKLCKKTTQLLCFAAPASLGRTPLPLLFGFPSQHHDRSRWPPTSVIIPTSLAGERSLGGLPPKSPGTKDGKLLALLRCARSKTMIKLKGAAAVWFFRGQKPSVFAKLRSKIPPF